MTTIRIVDLHLFAACRSSHLYSSLWLSRGVAQGRLFRGPIRYTSASKEGPSAKDGYQGCSILPLSLPLDLAFIERHKRPYLLLKAFISLYFALYRPPTAPSHGRSHRFESCIAHHWYHWTYVILPSTISTSRDRDLPSTRAAVLGRRRSRYLEITRVARQKPEMSAPESMMMKASA